MRRREFQRRFYRSSIYPLLTAEDSCRSREAKLRTRAEFLSCFKQRTQRASAAAQVSAHRSRLDNIVPR